MNKREFLKKSSLGVLGLAALPFSGALNALSVDTTKADVHMLIESTEKLIANYVHRLAHPLELRHKDGTIEKLEGIPLGEETYELLSILKNYERTGKWQQ